MRITDNWPALSALFAAIPRALDLDRAGPSGAPLGDELLDAAADAIYEQTVVAQQDPDSNPLAPLRPYTLDRKRRLGYPETILVETAKMTAVEQLRGERDVGPASAVAWYGVSDPEVQKAEWAHEGAPGRAKRPFFGIPARALPLLGRAVDQAADAYLARL